MSVSNKAVPITSAKINDIEIGTQKSCLGVREVLSRVGDKWSVLVVSILDNGPLRFNELQKRIEGISQRMLTLTLRGLERDGLVSRRVESSMPPKVEYKLTGLGKTLLEPVQMLVEWSQKHYPDIIQAQQVYDVNNPAKPEIQKIKNVG